MKILDFGRKVLGLNYSPLQQVILLAARGEPLTDEQAAMFEKHAGRPWPGPGEPPDEVHLICGRQSGKTGYIGPTLVLHAAMDPATVQGLGPGFWRDVVAVAPTRRQARIAYQRIRRLVEETPELRRYLKTEPTQNEIELDFGVRIGIWTAKGAHLRGLQPRLLLLDEACFLPAEGPRADFEVLEAVRPGMAMVPGGQIVTISTPWVEQGFVHERFRRRAELQDVLVFQAASWELNPWIPQAFLDRERERDPDYFAREYGGEFSGTIQAFLPAVSVHACTAFGRKALPPRDGVDYTAAIDQAYKQDTFVLGIAHREGDVIVVDRLHGWAPGRGNPVRLELLLPELEALVRPYGVTRLLGDQFGAVAFREVLRSRGMAYEERVFTSDSKRDMYTSLKMAIVSEKMELLDHNQSLRELRSVESRVTPTGTVRIGAPPGFGFHDDYADTLAILAHELRPSGVYSGSHWGLLRHMKRRLAEREKVAEEAAA